MNTDNGNLALIEQGNNYKIFEEWYGAYLQRFRYWNDGTVEIAFTDDFCRANGFKNRKDMLNQHPRIKQQIMQCCGDVPDWLIIQQDGSGFAIRNMNLN